MTRCAWCELPAVGYALVEPGYGAGVPSCGSLNHGCEFSQDEDMQTEMIRLIMEQAWYEGFEVGVQDQYGRATPSGIPYDPPLSPYTIERRDT